MSDYQESLPAPRWLIGIVVLASIAMLVAALVILLAEDISSVARVALALTLGAAGAAMLFVARTFATLSVEVTSDGVEFGFGVSSFRKALAAHELIAAAPDRYPWLRYGGWGVRFSTGGYRAYSQAFERGSVVIEATDQHRYHVSSKNPAALAEAINEVATARSASH